MTATRQRICKLITKNLEKRTKTLLHYHSIRKKLMADFSLFTAINNTYGVFFLSSVVVFCPINALMAQWVLIGGVKKNVFPLMLVVNQSLLIFVSHWYLTKCSLQIHLNCRPLLSLSAFSVSNLKSTEYADFSKIRLKLANDVCAFHCKKKHGFLYGKTNFNFGVVSLSAFTKFMMLYSKFAMYTTVEHLMHANFWYLIIGHHQFNFFAFLVVLLICYSMINLFVKPSVELRISWLIEKNLSRKNKRLIQYYSIRQKLATDIALFSAISNTFGMMFLTTTVVFCPINAIMTLWILVGGLQKNFLPLLMIVNQILLIFVSHWYLTKCSLQIHLNCRPLLSLAVIGSKNKKFLKQRKNATESSEIRVQLKLANDICVLHIICQMFVEFMMLYGKFVMVAYNYFHSVKYA
ncbi:hypothetical protein TYRP_003204, partial [Tyrophagus putrescentiae]